MEVAFLRNLDATRRHNRWRHSDCQADISYICLAVAVTSSIVALRVAYESESCFFRAVRSTLPSPLASLFPAAKAFRPVWSKRSELTERDWEKAVQGLGNGQRTFTYISHAIRISTKLSRSPDGLLREESLIFEFSDIKITSPPHFGREVSWT